ncbi:MAG: histidine phosphatase family protein [Polaromonas sp.]|nr:histidine phosphatase family protein [Polaromonas sp.]
MSVALVKQGGEDDAPAPTGTLWLARHAQPLVESGVCYGQLDIPADAQATATSARALAVALPPGIRIVCSPLQRCELLTQTLCGLRADLTYKLDSRLMEMNFGNWEGRRWSGIGQPAIDAWVADFTHHRPGGGESVSALLRRVAGIWEEARAGERTLWITHAGVIRAATLLHAGQRHIDRADQWPLTAPEFGGWTVLNLPSR